MQRMVKAFCLALARAGSSNAAKIAMMAITTSNSISVKARVGSPSLDEMICPGDRARRTWPSIALATVVMNIACARRFSASSGHWGREFASLRRLAGGAELLTLPFHERGVLAHVSLAGYHEVKLAGMIPEKLAMDPR